jgi:hypothetical protein
MENIQWKPVFYNGKETNVEVTKYGDVRRVKVAFMKKQKEIGIVDFSKLKLHPKGYRLIGIQVKGLKSKTLFVHQLVAAAFLDYKFKGMLMVVDHKNEPKTNNSIDNLQLLTNRQNTSKERTEKKGLPTGVSFHKRNKKYEANIFINGKSNYLGYYDTPEQASKAYKAALFQDKQYLQGVLMEFGMFSVPMQVNNGKTTTY